MHSLKLSLDDFEVGSDEMLAIAVHAPGLASYKLAHFLNKKMSWDLANIENPPHEPRPYRPFENPSCLLETYSHEDEINRVQYFLVENRFRQQVWIPKMSDVDYWIVIAGAGIDFLDTNETLRLLSETDCVFSAALLPLENGMSTRTSPLFKYFQSFYDEMENREIIRHFE